MIAYSAPPLNGRSISAPGADSARSAPTSEVSVDVAVDATGAVGSFFAPTTSFAPTTVPPFTDKAIGSDLVVRYCALDGSNHASSIGGICCVAGSVTCTGTLNVLVCPSVDSSPGGS